MRINFIPKYAAINPARAPKNNPAAGKPSIEPAFRGYFLDHEKYNPGQHNSLYYFCEHLEEGEKPKRGQNLCGANKNLVFNRNFTSFFRDDVNWIRLGQLLCEKFKDADKVNTMVYACSNGLEAYTFSALIQKTFPKNPEKFFPIIAKDISKQQIEENKLKQKEDVKISLNEAMAASGVLAFGVYDDFYKLITKNKDGAYVITEKTKAPVVFEAANILDDLDSVDSSAPTIFACRNMWPYVKAEEYQPFSDELYKRLASGSVVIIGDFDYRGAQMQNKDSIADALIQSGFKRVNSFCDSFKDKCIVFEKR